MIGKYKTSDNSVYEVFIGKVDRRDTLMARCVSSKTKGSDPFPMIERNLQMNITRGLWVKID